MRIDQPAADSAWPGLLAMKRFLAESDGAETDGPALPDVALVPDSSGWRVGSPGECSADDGLFVTERPDFAPPAAASGRVSVLRLDATGRVATFEHPNGRPLDYAVLAFFRLYVPLVYAAERALRDGRSFVIGHVAQTLDGRIACVNGHSHWISNDANLTHAHRLRALHDAVLVGGRTVERDDPQLTVRLVEGDDPVRVILSGSANVLRGDASYRALDEGVVVCRESSEIDTDDSGGAKVLTVRSPPATMISPTSVLAALRCRGLRTIFVEGGGTTLSSFLEHDAIDVLHVHVAPIVLGSGVDSFSLPEVERIQQARRFDVQHFLLDGEVLFECWPAEAR